MQVTLPCGFETTYAILHARHKMRCLMSDKGYFFIRDVLYRPRNSLRLRETLGVKNS